MSDLNFDKKKTVSFQTLGCKLNFAETATFERMFSEHGYLKVSTSEPSEYFVINTCSVTQVADKKCRTAINKASRNGSKVIVVGCYSQLKPDEIAAMEGVHLVLGTNDKFKILDFINEKDPSKKIHNCGIENVKHFDQAYSIGERTRAFLKIQDGCDYNCTYCTIPKARGISRSMSIEEILKNVNEIEKNDIKEIVLTGVNIGEYLSEKSETFYELIQALDKNTQIARYRISSIEPNLLSHEIIDFVKQSTRFAHHFHIPLQSGNNKILALMSRRYKTELYAERLQYIKKALPDACIGSDVIVGFPGESEEDFEVTYEFIKSMPVDYLHVFPYSIRPGTKAASMPNHVAYKIKEERSKQLIALGNNKKKAFYERNIGKEGQAIFESRKNKKYFYGFTNNYIEVITQSDLELNNTVQIVSLEEVDNEGFMKCKII